MTRAHLSRRTLLLAAAACAATSNAWAAEAGGPLPIKNPVPRTSTPIKIGVIGSGRIGGTYGEIWSRAGHQVMFSDRDLATAQAAAAHSPGARAGTTQEAAAFGDVVLLTVPYGAMQAISRELGPTLRGKVIIDTGNPQPARDGEWVRPLLEKGSGVATASLLPGAKIVRAFNVLSFANAANLAWRPGDKVAIPVGGDDALAVALASRLIRDAGFEPLPVPGGLAGTKRFDLGPPMQGKAPTVAEARALLGL